MHSEQITCISIYSYKHNPWCWLKPFEESYMVFKCFPMPDFRHRSIFFNLKTINKILTSQLFEGERKRGGGDTITYNWSIIRMIVQDLIEEWDSNLWVQLKAVEATSSVNCVIRWKYKMEQSNFLVSFVQHRCVVQNMDHVKS